MIVISVVVEIVVTVVVEVVVVILVIVVAAVPGYQSFNKIKLRYVTSPLYKVRILYTYRQHCLLFLKSYLLILSQSVLASKVK